MAETRPADQGRRIAAVDSLRGAAVLAMIVYHLAWDLSDAGLIDADVVGDPLWRGFARSIAGAFLILVGVSLVLATRNGLRWRPYLRRLAAVAGAAGMVSLGTFWFQPGTFVFFGILHMIVLGSILALPFLSLPSWIAVLAALAALAAPRFLADPYFDTPAWWWLGLSTGPPPTVDYVPLLPWLAPILAGIIIGRLMAASEGRAFVVWSPATPGARLTALIGRWSLPIYLLHQPLLIGALSVLVPLLPANPAAAERVYLRDCNSGCRGTGADPPTCELFCFCVHSGFKAKHLLAVDETQSPTPDERLKREAVLDTCRNRAADGGPPGAALVP